MSDGGNNEIPQGNYPDIHVPYPVDPAEFLRTAAAHIREQIATDNSWGKRILAVFGKGNEDALATAEGYEEAATQLEQDPTNTELAVHALRTIYNEGERFKRLYGHQEREDDLPFEGEEVTRTIESGAMAAKALEKLGIDVTKRE